MAFEEPTGTSEKTTDELLAEVLVNQQAHREEVAALRQEVATQKAAVPPPAASATARTPEELAEARRAEIAEHSHYCPGCGRLFHYLRECTGRPEAPHPPIDVVAVDELQGDDTSAHTAAPNTDRLG